MKKIIAFICVVIMVISMSIGYGTVAAKKTSTSNKASVTTVKKTTKKVSTTKKNNKKTTTKKVTTTKKSTKKTTKKKTTKKITVNTKKYKKEIQMIAKVIYREARGVKSKAQQAAVAWCILNRVDSKGFPNTISKVITQPRQFAWYPNTPVKKEFEKLAEDVVRRWLLEKKGQKKVGRTLPKNYLYFYGDGKRNHFRKTYRGKTTWNWSLPSPY